MATTYPKNLIPDFIELSELSDFRVLETEAEDGSSQRLTDEESGWKTQLRLRYSALTLDEVYLLTQFYHSVQGKYTWFRLPTNIFSLDEEYQDRVNELAGDFKWKFKSSPTIRTEINNLHAVEAVLEAVKTSFNREVVAELPDVVSGKGSRTLPMCEITFSAEDIDYTAAFTGIETLNGCNVNITSYPLDTLGKESKLTIDRVSVAVEAFTMTYADPDEEDPDASGCETLKFKIVNITTPEYTVSKSDGGWRLYLKFSGQITVYLPPGISAGWQIELIKYSDQETDSIVFAVPTGQEDYLRYIFSGGSTESGLSRVFSAVHVLSMGRRAVPGGTVKKWTYHLVGANTAVV